MKLTACSSAAEFRRRKRRRGHAEKMSRLNVPVLFQGYPDDLRQPPRGADAFCGRFPWSRPATSKHVSHPTSDGFASDLQNFLGVCRVAECLARCAARRGVAVGPRALQMVRLLVECQSRRWIFRIFPPRPASSTIPPPPRNGPKSKVVPPGAPPG